MNSYKIGIIVADEDEYKSLSDYIESGSFEEYSVLSRKGHKFTITKDQNTVEVYSILCGIGKVNAAAATMHLVDIGCNLILNYGLSGGISGISRGELCLCNRFLEHDFDLTGIGYKPCEKPSQKYIYEADSTLLNAFKSILPSVKTGTAVTGDSFVCDANLRNSLKENFSAMCCDMETAAIAYVCDASNIPFISLRRISDDAGSNSVDDYREMNSSYNSELSDYVIEFIKQII